MHQYFHQYVLLPVQTLFVKCYVIQPSVVIALGKQELHIGYLPIRCWNGVFREVWTAQKLVTPMSDYFTGSRDFLTTPDVHTGLWRNLATEAVRPEAFAANFKSYLSRWLERFGAETAGDLSRTSSFMQKLKFSHTMQLKSALKTQLFPSISHVTFGRQGNCCCCRSDVTDRESMLDFSTYHCS